MKKIVDELREIEYPNIKLEYNFFNYLISDPYLLALAPGIIRGLSFFYKNNIYITNKLLIK
jgi:hypothetical protein